MAWADAGTVGSVVRPPQRTAKNPHLYAKNRCADDAGENQPVINGSWVREKPICVRGNRALHQVPHCRYQ